MPALNRITLIGRLTQNPDCKYVQNNTALAKFTLAVDRDAKVPNGERKTDFFKCLAWRQSADFIRDYVTKGQLVYVEGRLEINEFTDREGNRRWSTDVQVSRVVALESARNNNQSQDYYPDQQQEYYPDYQ